MHIYIIYIYIKVFDLYIQYTHIIIYTYIFKKNRLQVEKINYALLQASEKLI